MSLTCQLCGRTFTRPRPRGRRPVYCRLLCRNRIGRRRRDWDAMNRFYKLNRDMEGRTPLQRATWQREWDKARDELGWLRP
jgi:hypothetical protein